MQWPICILHVKKIQLVNIINLIMHNDVSGCYEICKILKSMDLKNETHGLGLQIITFIYGPTFLLDNISIKLSSIFLEHVNCRLSLLSFFFLLLMLKTRAFSRVQYITMENYSFYIKFVHTCIQLLYVDREKDKLKNIAWN